MKLLTRGEGYLRELVEILEYNDRKYNVKLKEPSNMGSFRIYEVTIYKPKVKDDE